MMTHVVEVLEQILHLRVVYYCSEDGLIGYSSVINSRVLELVISIVHEDRESAVI